MDLVTVGWREWVALPGLDIPAIKGKIDSGARTSCLHAFQITPFDKDGAPWARFLIHPIQHQQNIVRECTAQIVDRRYVTNSGGDHDLRYVIISPMRIETETGEVHEWPVEITLSNRESMMFRMLIGRTAMHNRLIVNPVLSFQLKKVFPNDIARLYPS